ncbi:hypothetical protein SAMN05216511_3343 [Streptomyces sp. KS_16]|nr:hypothetical protein BX261_3855 [Streptomyces sp. 2321.6]SDR37449.1 hypothetical protein SAMN05216511_3343 [Streptomyces sp. KS_16]SED12591.1 hypothetical protein SAMN05428940_3883 [Streptomyces sp. 2133.1]SNC69971.1 hypothetical protein SAMN06272741_3849 [Streptomyces sp. 2114.4]
MVMGAEAGFMRTSLSARTCSVCVRPRAGPALPPRPGPAPAPRQGVEPPGDWLAPASGLSGRRWDSTM